MSSPCGKSVDANQHSIQVFGAQFGLKTAESYPKTVISARFGINPAQLELA